MKRIQPTMTAIVVTLVIGVIAVAAASAAEKTKVLPEPTALVPISFTLRTPVTMLIVALGGQTIHCSSAIAESSGAFTSFNLGTGKPVFTECTGPLNSICTAVGDSEGVILFQSTLHYLLALEMTTGSETTLVGALALLFPQFHITCEALGQKQLVLLRGCEAGKDDSAEKLTKRVRILFKQWATGETRVLEILPPEATSESKCLPEISINAGAFTLAAFEGELSLEKWIKAGVEVEVLLMNK